MNSVAATDSSATEPSDGGIFTVTISNPSDTDTTISYTVSGDATAGSDYTSLSGTVTILAGQTTANINVSVIDDSILEDNESVTITLDTYSHLNRPEERASAVALIEKYAMTSNQVM